MLLIVVIVAIVAITVIPVAQVVTIFFSVDNLLIPRRLLLSHLSSLSDDRSARFLPIVRLEKEVIISFFRLFHLFLLLLGLEVSSPLIQEVLLLRLWSFLLHKFTLDFSNRWTLIIHSISRENVGVLWLGRFSLPELQFRQFLLSEYDVCR